MASFHLSLDGTLPPECRHGAITIGNFDGVHLGHQALLAEAKRQAGSINGPTVAVTFDPHPLQLLRPEAFQPVLTSMKHRADLLQRHGADHIVILETGPALLQLSAQEFFDRIVMRGLEARHVVEGFNFYFGKGREGSLDTLKQLSQMAGIGLTVVAEVDLDRRPVSSSRVRNELVAGNVAGAALLLGRPFRLAGIVGTGQRRGQSLGFPTANLQQVETIVPGNGVYAVRAWLGERSWPAAANVGPNPTFGEQERKIEAHLIGFRGELYGQTLSLDFLAKLRDTRPFADAADLIAQLCLDVAQAKEVLTP